ncbi:lasso RiPP family leader peptide-containing protein [Novosphingobium sp. 17-62-19]|uniref:lasso RiPP family leader peptide-containing protein n=1 Tax=Novosphingobium sp. 17-62-19 TaxID=1970406 RepID=UPI0025FD24D7|nr:lasso RiPP family leader peptide-containing protein [Novosphingobium sp. 17-62-19]HQS95376.1 lasso RiPP family leader peptide-containing protein [Novosphingobium sp.]
MTDRNSNARNASDRRTYARPALTVYGSVRELTGGMSSSGSDGMLMLNMMGV